MNYWITVHWPPLNNETNPDVNGVFVPDGRQAAGADLQEGDKILIYESLSGRTVLWKDINGEVHKLPSIRGRMGVVAIVEAVTELRNHPDEEITKYANGTEILWSWYAETKTMRDSGYVSAKTLNKLLGYKESFNYRGFGTLHSGLKKITKEQYEAIVSEYKKGDKQKLKVPPRFFPDGAPKTGGGESEAHKKLKSYVANNPSKALGIAGLNLVDIEYIYPTGDRADIVLRDFEGRLIAVEIEIEQDWDIVGLLQAIKYKYMLAPMHNMNDSEILAFLVAYKISNYAKNLCAKYGVSFFEIEQTNT